MDNIYIQFGNKFYRQIVGIPMGTNCAPLVADLFLFCYERDFMTSLSDDNQADWSRGQSEIYGLFLIFVAPPRKKNLLAIMSWGHVLGTWKTMFD